MRNRLRRPARSAMRLEPAQLSPPLQPFVEPRPMLLVRPLVGNLELVDTRTLVDELTRRGAMPRCGCGKWRTYLGAYDQDGYTLRCAPAVCERSRSAPADERQPRRKPDPTARNRQRRADWQSHSRCRRQGRRSGLGCRAQTRRRPNPRLPARGDRPCRDPRARARKPTHSRLPARTPPRNPPRRRPFEPTPRDAARCSAHSRLDAVRLYTCPQCGKITNRRYCPDHQARSERPQIADPRQVRSEAVSGNRSRQGRPKVRSLRSNRETACRRPYKADPRLRCRRSCRLRSQERPNAL